MALTIAQTDVSVQSDASTQTETGIPEKPPRRHGYLIQALAFTRTRVGLGLVGFVALVAIFGGFLAPYNTVQFVGADFSAPARHYLLGTDYLGRDVLSRFLNGGHFILIMSVLGTIIGTGSGMIIGLAAGYSMKRLDQVLMRCIDLLMAFPGLVFALLMIT